MYLTILSIQINNNCISLPLSLFSLCLPSLTLTVILSLSLSASFTLLYFCVKIEDNDCNNCINLRVLICRCCDVLLRCDDDDKDDDNLNDKNFNALYCISSLLLLSIVVIIST